MADFTPQQLQAMQALIAGTFDKLDTTPKIQPGYSLSDIYGGMYPPSGSSVASSFPARPGVPFANTSRDRLQPNANPDIPGAGVAANDWYSKPGSYVNQLGTVKVSDLPALKKSPIDITVRGGNTVNTLLAMMGGSRPGAAKQPQVDTSFPGTAVRYKTAIGPQMGTVGGKQPVTKVAATMKPGWQFGDGLLALLTQNMKQPAGGGGLLASLFGGGQQQTAVGSKLDTVKPGTLFGGTKADFTRGLAQMIGAGGVSPSQAYDTRNLAAQMFAQAAPRTGTSTNGYVYQNGQNVGTTRAPGESAASQYDRAAAAARASSPDNGGNPSWW